MFDVAKEGIRCSFIKQQPINTGFLDDISCGIHSLLISLRLPKLRQGSAYVVVRKQTDKYMYYHVLIS
jgi:hypothetical protein